MEPYVIAALTLFVGGLAVLAFNRPRVYQKMSTKFLVSALLIYTHLAVWTIASMQTYSKVLPLLVAAKIEEKAAEAVTSLTPHMGIAALGYLGVTFYFLFLGWLANHVIDDDTARR